MRYRTLGQGRESRRRSPQFARCPLRRLGTVPHACMEDVFALDQIDRAAPLVGKDSRNFGQSLAGNGGPRVRYLALRSRRQKPLPNGSAQNAADP